MANQKLPKGVDNYYVPGSNAVLTPVDIIAQPGETPYTATAPLRIRIERDFIEDDLLFTAANGLSVTAIADGVKLELTLNGATTEALRNRSCRVLIEIGQLGAAVPLFWFALLRDPSGFRVGQ